MGNANKIGLAVGLTVTASSIIGLAFADGTLNTTLQLVAGFAGAVSLFFGWKLTRIDQVEFEAVQKDIAQQETHIVSEAVQKDLVADDYYMVITREFTDL